MVVVAMCRGIPRDYRHGLALRLLRSFRQPRWRRGIGESLLAHSGEEFVFGESIEVTCAFVAPAPISQWYVKPVLPTALRFSRSERFIAVDSETVAISEGP